MNDRPTDAIRVDDDDGFTCTSSDVTVTDLNVERREDDPQLVNEVPDGTVIDNDDSGGSGLDELDCRNDEQRQTDSDHVNDDDATPNNRTTTSESDGDGRTGRQTDDDGYLLVTGVAALDDGSLVVADYGAACVCLCDDDGRPEHRVTGLKPFSVAAAADQLIYVGDRRRKTLVALDRHGADVAQWPDHTFDWVCGVACLSDGQLAVLDRGRTRQLGVYDAAGAVSYTHLTLPTILRV